MLKDEDSIVTLSLNQFNVDYETVSEFASMIDINGESLMTTLQTLVLAHVPN